MLATIILYLEFFLNTYQGCSKALGQFPKILFRAAINRAP
ncbi:hypothetical protein SAMN02745219_00048 [Desulfofundulus thermosubterraneus DSM 16057]|uniref:Uncharacterized protein n=1 Tax=Desulfofundulus thermosubterraneus DSM 16057 TaxID=1121432 RepID=A0A1M6A852_9FIRM|nr:hypothetical protein SAMN02745219_00048 [Desulfofundulus thermosubterraneus DSM 16057]